MTALGLILAIHLCGLSFALLLARSVTRRQAGGAELRRVGAAVARASEGLLNKEMKLALLAGGVLAPAAFAAHALLRPKAGSLGPLEAGFWAGFALEAGVVVTCLVVRAGAWITLGASLGAPSASQRSLDRALTSAVRAGGAAGLLLETTSLAAPLLLFGLLFAMKGGFKLDLAQAEPLIRAVGVLLPSYALGVALGALVVQRGGSTYHAAGDMAADLAGERDATLAHDDRRNPAAVADLVGDHVGAGANRIADAFLSATAAHVSVGALGAVLLGPTLASHPGAATVLLLPWVVRSFGVIASAFGVMVVRTEERETSTHALWRGHATTSLITLGGLCGSAWWLVGEPRWTRWFWAGSLGLLAALVSGYAARLRADRRLGSMRELTEALRVGEAPGVAQGLALGLEAIAVPLVITGAALAGAFHLGASTGLPQGGLWASLTALMVMLATGPYALALGILSPIADGARGAGAVSGATLGSDGDRRAARVEELGFAGSGVSRTQLIVVGSLTALLIGVTLPLVAGSAADASRVELTRPLVLFSGLVGLVAVAVYAARALRAAAHGARAVAVEVERQLRGFPREAGRAVIPPDFTPSYRTCVEIAERAALRRLLLPVGVALAAPIALAAGLWLLSRSGGLVSPADGLAAFVVFAAVCGFSGALAMEGARTAFAAVNRALRANPVSLGHGPAIGADSLGDALGNAAGPAAQIVVSAVAVTSLAMAPFLSP